MAVTIDQAMNDLGAGGINIQEFVQALASSIVGAVGPAKKFGGESSEDKKRAEEQLKKMEQLSDGLDELNETLKAIQKVIKDTKDKAKSTNNDFKNLSSAMNRLADNLKSGGGIGGGGDKKTFDNLNKMAKEAVTGHSLHVHDFTVVSRLDTLISQVKTLSAVMSGGKTKGGSKTKSVADTSVGNSASGLGSATGLGSANGIGEATDIANQSEKTSEIYKILVSNADKWAGKLEISKEDMIELLRLSAEMVGYDEEKLLHMEQSLNHLGHMNKYDRKRVQDALTVYRAYAASEEVLNKTEGHLEKQQQLLKQLGFEIQQAGEHMQLRFGDSLAKIQAKVQAVLNVLNMLSPSNVIRDARISMDPSTLLTNANDTVMNASQLTMSLGGPVGNITNQIGSWQHSMYSAFMSSGQQANELMMTMQDFNAEMTRLARRGFRSEQAMNDQARIGLGLGRMIGANAEQTSDELANWVQSFNLSAVQARVLSTQVQAVGRATGVTGDNLLAAVKSARNLAEQMRNTGSLTESANDTLIRFSATARRMGTEQITNPLIQAMGNFDPRNPLAAMLVQAAQRGGVSNQDLMNSNIIGNQQNERAMVTSLAQLRDEMRGLLQGGTSLMAVNQMLSARGYNQGFGAFDRAVDTLEDTVRTIPERIARLQGSINENTTASERRRIAQEIAQLQTTGGMNNLAFLQRMATRMGGGGINALGSDRNSARTAIGNMATELAEHLDYNALRARGIEVQNVEELQEFAMQSGRNFNEVIEALSTFGQTRQAAGDRSRDPATALRAAIIDFQNSLQTRTNTAIQTLYENVSANSIVNTGLTIEITRATIELGLNIINLGTNINNLILALGLNTTAVGLNSTGIAGLGAAGGPFVLLTAALVGATLVWNRYNQLNAHHEAQRQEVQRRLAASNTTRDTEAAGIRASNDPNQLRATITTLDAEVQTQNVLMDRLQNQIRRATIADDLAGRTELWRADEIATRTQLERIIANALLARERLAALNAAAPPAAVVPPPAARVDLPPVQLAPNQRILTAEEAAARGLPVLPAGDAHIETRPTMMQNLGNRLRTGITNPQWGQLWPFEEGTREIKNTGLGILHQGEMVVPQGIAKHLGAQGTGPFNDSVALVRPAGNDALMQRRVQTEFAGTESGATMSRANSSLDDISASNHEQTELMRQELAVLRQLLSVWTSSGNDTTTNSRPTSPPNYHQWAVRPLNSPSYGGIENYARG